MFEVLCLGLGKWVEGKGKLFRQRGAGTVALTAEPSGRPSVPEVLLTMRQETPPEFPGKSGQQHQFLPGTSRVSRGRSPFTPTTSCIQVSPQHTHLPRGIHVKMHLEQPGFSRGTDTEGEKRRERQRYIQKIKGGERARMNSTLEERREGEKKKKKGKFP